jgi:SlyX protein
MTEKLERIEMKIAYLEQANAELSDLVYAQMREIDALKLRLAGIAARFDAAQAAPTQYSADEERPPHY